MGKWRDDLRYKFDAAGNATGIIGPDGKTVGLRAVLGKIGPGLSAGQHHWSPPAYPSGTANVTIQNQIPAPANWKGCQLVYANGTAAVATLGFSKASVTAVDADNGSALAWTSVLFSGAGTVALPVISGAEPQAIKSLMVSDHISRPSNSPGDFLMVRSYFADSGCALNPAAGELAAFRVATGLKYKSGFVVLAGGVLDASPINMTEGQLICPEGVIWHFDRPALTLACVGGSTLRGQGSSANATGMVYRAAASLTNSARIVSPYVAAFSGKNSTSSMGDAIKIIDAIAPDVLLFQCGSGNDADLTAEGFEAAKGRTTSVVNTCRKKGVVPILCTLPPSSALTAPQEALRIAQNAWALSLSDQYVLVADIATAVADPSNAAQLLPAYNSGDGTHINDAGCDAASAVIAAVVARLI